MVYPTDTRETIICGVNRYFIRVRSCDESNQIVLFLHGAAAVQIERK